MSGDALQLLGVLRDRGHKRVVGGDQAEAARGYLVDALGVEVCAQAVSV